jgi:hypothetical protein
VNRHPISVDPLCNRQFDGFVRSVAPALLAREPNDEAVPARARIAADGSIYDIDTDR